MPRIQGISFKQRLTDALIGLGVCIISMPVAFLLTIALLPLWRWLENNLTIESIGHSGPAEWCYLFTYIIILAVASITWTKMRQERSHKG